MDAQELHRTEHLEAEIRRLRQLLRNLSEVAIAGDPDLVVLAEAARDLIDPV